MKWVGVGCEMWELVCVGLGGELVLGRVRWELVCVGLGGGVGP